MNAQDLRPYPAYRDSGLAWLGQVPEHWSVVRLKNWLTMNREVLPESMDPDYRFNYLDIGSVGTGRLTEEPASIRFADAPSRARRVVRTGDTVVSTVRTYLKAVWHVGEPIENLVASTGFVVLSPKAGAAPKFVSYVAQSSALVDRIVAESMGIAYPAIPETRLGTFAVAVPRPSEQMAIVRFLDHADRRIRRAIRANEKLIALLEEQKQALIHDAVTGRTDVRTGQPYPAYKPSGVEWLGEVPAHWRTMRGKRLFAKVERPVAQEDEVVTCFRDGTVTRRRNRRESGFTESLKEIGYQGVRRGDLVIHGMDAFAGACGVADSNGKSSPVYSVCVPRDKGTSSRYFASLVREMARGRWILALARGVRERSTDFRYAAFGDQVLPVPSIAEQRAIVHYLSAANATTDHAIELNRRQIAVADEYRARLISDVVTGKLDVREAAAALPDEDAPTAGEEGHEGL